MSLSTLVWDLRSSREARMLRSSPVPPQETRNDGPLQSVKTVGTQGRCVPHLIPRVPAVCSAISDSFWNYSPTVPHSPTMPCSLCLPLSGDLDSGLVPNITDFDEKLAEVDAYLCLHRTHL